MEAHAPDIFNVLNLYTVENKKVDYKQCLPEK